MTSAERALNLVFKRMGGNYNAYLFSVFIKLATSSGFGNAMRWSIVVFSRFMFRDRRKEERYIGSLV